MAFKVATKDKARARIALIGPSGSGKTYSALRIARGLVGPQGRIGVVDTENRTASKYADLFRFEVDELDSFSPARYIEKIQDAHLENLDVLIIDSLSHAWMGKDGALEQVDRAAARSKTGNSFAAWREVTPQHNQLVEAIIRSPLHIIATMRAKTEYVQEKDADGKTVIRKVGMAPIQRDGLEYEFDVVGDMDLDNRLIVSKTRCPALNRAVIKEPGEDLGAMLAQWLGGPSADEILTYVQTEADHCETPDHVASLKKLLYSKGGSYFTEAVKVILSAAYERVKPKTPAEAPKVPATTEEAGLPMFDDKAAGNPPDDTPLARAKMLLQGRLDAARTIADFDKVKDDCAKEGGLFGTPEMLQYIDSVYIARFQPGPKVLEGHLATP